MTETMAGELLPVLRDRAGRDVSTEHRDQLAVLIDAWLIAVCRSDHTYAAYRGDMVVWLAWCDEIGVYPLTATRTDVDGWLRVMERRPLARTGKPAAEATLARRVSTVASFYGFAADDGAVERSPVAARGRPQAPRDSSTTGLSRAEAVAVLRRLPTEPLRDQAVMQTLLMDGLRVAELAALDVDSLGYDSGQAVLRVHGKGRKKRTIVAAPPVVAAIHAMLDERAGELGIPRAELPAGSAMFPGNTAGRLSRWQVLRIVKRIVRAAGVESWSDISPHSLRHACITLMLDAGQDIHRVADHAGHATVGTTERYDRRRGQLSRTPVHALVNLLDTAT